eukprot:2521896-Amphidinium_carterae.2
MAPKGKAKATSKRPLDAAAASTPVPRKLQRRDTDAQVSRIIEENFAMLSATEVDSNKVDGKTLREAITQLKRDKKLVQGRLSQSCRERLQRQFSAEGSIQDRLVVKDKTQNISEQVRMAVENAKHKNPAKRTRATMEGVFSADLVLNQRELVGCLRTIVNPKLQYPSERRHVVKFMEYLGRNGVHMNFGVEVGLFEDVFDKALAGSWAELRKQGLSEVLFVDRFKNAFKVLSLHDDFVVLRKKNVEASDLKKTLARVMRFAVGKKMFGSSSLTISHDEFTESVDRAVLTLYAGDITQARLDECKADP